MTAECLSIKKKELIKTIHTNYFNQSKDKRKNKGEKIIALETTAPRKLSLSEVNVFRGSDDKKKQGRIRKKIINWCHQTTQLVMQPQKDYVKEVSAFK